MQATLYIYYTAVHGQVLFRSSRSVFVQRFEPRYQNALQAFRDLRLLQNTPKLFACRNRAQPPCKIRFVCNLRFLFSLAVTFFINAQPILNFAIARMSRFDIFKVSLVQAVALMLWRRTRSIRSTIAKKPRFSGINDAMSSVANFSAITAATATRN